MSVKNRGTIRRSYDFQAYQKRSQRRCFSQTALLSFEVLPDLSPALPGAPRLVVSAPSYSEGRQECPPMVWYSPEIDAYKFTLHILSDTAGGFQSLKYILLMYWRSNTDTKLVYIANCSTSKCSLMVAENSILIRYYLHTANTRTLYESMDGRAGRQAHNPPKSDVLGVYDGTVPKWELCGYWRPGPRIL
jgi:hypothetical protein